MLKKNLGTTIHVIQKLNVTKMLLMEELVKLKEVTVDTDLFARKMLTNWFAKEQKILQQIGVLKILNESKRFKS